MTDGPGRTYKYLKDPSLALWPFGYGLSYTTFALSDARLAAPRLHVAAPGVLPAADMMEDAARAVGSALREALQPVSI